MSYRKSVSRRRTPGDISGFAAAGIALYIVGYFAVMGFFIYLAARVVFHYT